MSNTESSEGTLPERALALRREYYVRLAKFAVMLGADKHQAGAIADDALLEFTVRETRTDLDPVKHTSGWLHRYVSYTVLKIREANTRSREVSTDLHGFAGQIAQFTWPSPELYLEVREVLRALQTLPEDQRVPVVLAATGHSYAEIAGLLGIKDSLVAQRVRRGRQRLAEITGRIAAISARPPHERALSNTRSLRALSTTEEGRSG